MSRVPSTITAGAACIGSMLAIRAVIACRAVLGIEHANLEQGDAQDVERAAQCADYCAQIASNCQGVNQEYHGTGDCLTLCKYFSPGVDGDTTGNTVACRLAHANFAAAGPETHCPHAGPLGGPSDKCGPEAASIEDSRCLALCQLDLALCAGPQLAGQTCEDASTIAYEDLNDCTTVCKSYRFLNGGELVDDSGTPYESNNTFNCRLYHLENAAKALSMGNLPLTACHCWHATASGGRVCVDP